MKIIYNFKLKTLALLALAMVIVSCNDDDTPGQEPSNQKPIATTEMSALTITEGETGVVLFTMDRATTGNAYFKIQVTGEGATAVQDEDFTAGSGPLRPDTGNLGDGFEMLIPAGVTSFEIPINAVFDLDQTEGPQYVTLRISASGNRNVLIENTHVDIDVTIGDYEYCSWTLEMNDAYADGWQGGHITLEADGSHIADYAIADGATSTETIYTQAGTNITFSYVSGSTGTEPNAPGAPGWEEENTYTLTAPDGTIYSDGPVPAVGVIYTGSSCD